MRKKREIPISAFTCEVQADAQKIYEDTCYPETFHLYNDDFNPHKITFHKKNPAWDGWYEETPTDGWFCTVTPAKDANTVTVARKSVSRIPQAERITAISI